MRSLYARRARSHAAAGIPASLAERLDGLSRCSGQQIGMDEAVQIPVQDTLSVPDLVLGPVVFDELVRVKDIAADRVAAEAHADDSSFLRELLVPFLLRQLRKPRF